MKNSLIGIFTFLLFNINANSFKMNFNNIGFKLNKIKYDLFYMF